MNLAQYNEPELPTDAPRADMPPPPHVPAPSSAPPPAKPSAPVGPQPATHPCPGGAPVPKRRARGKISRLKPPVREKINHMMDEGLTYPEIIAALETDVTSLNETDLSRWYHSGHQHWLKNQLWLEETRSRLDMAIDVTTENEASKVHLANLQVAATQLISDLIQRGEALLTEHTEQYVAIINSIARIGHEALNFQKYSEACARAREELTKLKDPNRKLSDEETRAIVDRLDRILGFK